MQSSQIEPFPLSNLQAPTSRSPFLPGDMLSTGMPLTPLWVANGNVKQTGPTVSPCCSSPDTSPKPIPPHFCYLLFSFPGSRRSARQHPSRGALLGAVRSPCFLQQPKELACLPCILLFYPIDAEVLLLLWLGFGSLMLNLPPPGGHWKGPGNCCVPRLPLSMGLLLPGGWDVGVCLLVALGSLWNGFLLLPRLFKSTFLRLQSELL